jgi:uncharacterized membrane protein
MQVFLRLINHKEFQQNNCLLNSKGEFSMKRILSITAILTFIFLSAFSVYAAGTTPRSIDTIMSEIRQEQGAQNNDKINPDKVSQAKLEELGDSVMEAMIGNTAMHDQMDQKLGGDGSASLTAYHINLGYNYLAGSQNGMMRFNNTGNGSVGIGGMMGNLGWGGIIMGAIIFVLLIAILFFVIKAFTRKPPGSSLGTPLEILKRRYVNGEITQEEYERMADQLKK